VLGHGEGVTALCLAIPAGYTGEAMGNVRDLDIHGRGMGKVETASRQHALPDTRRFNRTLRLGTHPGHL
jgi:purine-nucleoside phosphorylase